MAAWLPKLLKRVHGLAVERRLMLTVKAAQELSTLDIGLDADDARDVLVRLTRADSAGRRRANATAEWMYVFKPVVAGVVVYVKLIVRDSCVIVSFHHDEREVDEEDE